MHRTDTTGVICHWIAQLEINVVLLGVGMRRMSGLEVLDALKGRATRPFCLVLTTFDDPELLLEAAPRMALSRRI
jgi:DNA-binding NarL/FixJ family response regulator